MKSILTKNQTRIFGPRLIAGYGISSALLTATVRYDDRCGNGHNTFSVTGEVTTARSRSRNDCEACGMLHEEIARVFPALAPVLKWHLCSTDGPMHYVANSLFWAGRTKYEKPNLKHFRSVAIWPDATEADMLGVTADVLNARLPALMTEFQAAILSLGFTY